MKKKITFEWLWSKVKQYKIEIIFIIVIIIFAALARTLCNIFLDYRVVLIIIAILWYLGHMDKIQQKFKEKIMLINYFKKSNEATPVEIYTAAE